jgi:hypothetical protein
MKRDAPLAAPFHESVILSEAKDLNSQGVRASCCPAEDV